MNLEKINNLAQSAESILGSTESTDPMYDYNRGVLDGIMQVMTKLGYEYQGGTFRRVRDGRK